MGHDVASDAARANWESDHVIERVVFVDGYSYCFGTEIDEHASETFFVGSKYHVGQGNLAHKSAFDCQRLAFGYGAVEVALPVLTTRNNGKVGLNVRSESSYRFRCVTAVDDYSSWHNVDND